LLTAAGARFRLALSNSLAAEAGLVTCATLARGAHGNSLVAARDVVAGEVLLAVPLDACLRFTRCPDTRRTTRWAVPDAPWVRRAHAASPPRLCARRCVR
jgi:hypothetical protein